jgi:hypothetical protein
MGTQKCKCKKDAKSWAWWCMPAIPGLKRQRQEDQEFEVSLGYMVSKTEKKKDAELLQVKTGLSQPHAWRPRTVWRENRGSLSPLIFISHIQSSPELWVIEHHYCGRKREREKERTKQERKSRALLSRCLSSLVAVESQVLRPHGHLRFNGREQF